MRKEIYMGHGLYKQVEVIETIEGDVEWKIVELEGGGFIRRPFPVKTESLRMQDELEPIYHATEHDESDDLEAAKIVTQEKEDTIATDARRRLIWGEGFVHTSTHCVECADRDADEILTGQAFSGLPFSSYQTEIEPTPPQPHFPKHLRWKGEKWTWIDKKGSVHYEDFID